MYIVTGRVMNTSYLYCQTELDYENKGPIQDIVTTGLIPFSMGIVCETVKDVRN